jgi:5-methylthioribose kinase
VSAEDLAAFADYQAHYMQDIFADSMAFAGLKIIRRIVGLAHVEDFESISDLAQRAKCESAALLLARQLVVGATDIHSISEMLVRMRSAEKELVC